MVDEFTTNLFQQRIDQWRSAILLRIDTAVDSPVAVVILDLDLHPSRMVPTFDAQEIVTVPTYYDRIRVLV